MSNNNNIYFNAACVGFMSGALAGRRSDDATAGDYGSLANAAAAFAAELDSLITFDSLVTTNASNTQLAITTNTIAANEQWRAGAMQALCHGQIQGRYSTDATQADWATDAAAVKAAWTELLTKLTTP